MKTNDIRSAFLNFFESKGHTRVASSPLVLPNDDSLLFVNSGMCQFKDLFLAKEKRDYVRATTAQKCLRVSGKHNDLDDVGQDARHHTFFEMLGNFSFGDYFKEKAILYAWEMVVSVLGFPKDRLWITVSPTDEEARILWKKIAGLSDDRIISHPDNFWEMGATGPCGSNTEIFYDQGDRVQGGPPGSKDEDGDRYLEFWNNVFMANERLEDGSVHPLKQQNIDTGLGLERTAALLQGKLDNYDIDLFQNIMKRISDLTGQKQTPENRTSFKVIADHIRTLSFLIADGILPSNEGRGYVFRRILRRAMRHAMMLGARDPILHLLAPSVEKEMGATYPELKNAHDNIVQTIALEEENFSRTLSSGLKVLEEETKGLSKGSTLSGEVAFKLYDTYGFPIDMTADALRSKGLKLDEIGFEKSMTEQRARSRAHKSFGCGTTTDPIWYDLLTQFGKTNFIGYDALETQSPVLAIVDEGALVSKTPLNKTVEVLTRDTPFYAESGGQAGDIGTIHGNKVLDTQKRADGLVIHVVEISAPFAVNDMVVLKIDSARRHANQRAHSAAHLFQAALRQVLGSHAAQRGSSVKDDVMRFDFSHPKAVSAQELLDIEKQVNDMIIQNDTIGCSVMPKEQALSSGVIALFGEKYGDTVRVVNMGQSSRELCGGTHAHRTGDIGTFKIIKESAVAAGIRRIEAYTGTKSIEHIQDIQKQYETILDALKTTPAQALERIQSVLDDNKKLQISLFNEEIKSCALDIKSFLKNPNQKELVKRGYRAKKINENLSIVFYPTKVEIKSLQHGNSNFWEILREDGKLPPLAILFINDSEKNCILSYALSPALNEALTKNILTEIMKNFSAKPAGVNRYLTLLNIHEITDILDKMDL